MTGDEEGRAFERRNHIEMYVHRALGRSETLAEFFAGLLHLHERLFPEHDWTPLRSLELEERNGPRARLPPANGGGLLVGIVHRHVADLVVATTESTAASPFVQWPGFSSLEPVGSRDLARLGRACFEGERAPRMEAATLLEGFAAKTAALLLARHAGLGDVFVGYHQTTPLWVGRLDETGFLPTPPAVAAARLRDQRARYVAGIVGMQGPPVAPDASTEDAPHDYVRALHHPDGRRWQVAVRGARLELRFTDEDGDEHSRARVSPDSQWEAQAMIRDQLREGFVDAP